MKYIIAYDHAQYQKWCHLNAETNGITCLHVATVWQLRRINLEGANELFELPNWQDNKTLEFQHAVQQLKSLKHL